VQGGGVRAKWRWCARAVGWCAASGYLNTNTTSVILFSKTIKKNKKLKIKVQGLKNKLKQIKAKLKKQKKKIEKLKKKQLRIKQEVKYKKH